MVDVEGHHGGRRDPPGRLLADEREDRPVVVAVQVDVEQILPGVPGDEVDGLDPPTFADVDDALEHGGG